MRRLVLTAILIVPISVFAANPCNEELPGSYGHVLADEVVGVYDGDTITVTINDWPSLIGQAIAVRVAGVDAPEIRGECAAEKVLAREARAFTRKAVTGAKRVELRNLRRDKYFRVLADVCLDGKPLSDGLIREGLGRHYEGGRKLGWCDL